MWCVEGWAEGESRRSQRMGCCPILVLPVCVWSSAGRLDDSREEYG